MRLQVCNRLVAFAVLVFLSLSCSAVSSLPDTTGNEDLESDGSGDLAVEIREADIIVPDSTDSADVMPEETVAAPDLPGLWECVEAGDCIAVEPLGACEEFACTADYKCEVILSVDGTTCLPDDICHSAGTCTAGICQGDIPADCNDDSPCTTDSCHPETGCAHNPADGSCDDDNACTEEDVCVDGECLGEAITCSDDNPCTSDSCDPAAGCLFLNIEGICDDGDPCTTGDLCDGGSCLSSGNQCECQDDMDCLPELDGDLCLLDVSCNTEEVPYVCEPAAVAECEPTLSICADNTCLPETGKCEVFPVLEGMDCDEPVNCVVAGTCTNGVCIGTPITCADENPCTSDVCEAGTGCVFTPQIIPCDDDDPCTINDFCTAGGVCLGSETGCEEPGSLVMRLTSLHFNAPGFCLPGPDDTCQDASALVNSFVAADLADPDSPLIMLAAFTPFDLAGDSSLFSLGPGECSADLNGENVCSFTYEPSKLSPVSFTSSGACTGPGDTTVDAPCFAVSGPAVDLGIMDIVFTVGDASVTGTFDGMPAPGSITDGHLEAFLSLEVAQLITVTLPLMPSYKLNQLLNPDEFVTQNGIPGWPIKAVFDAGYVTSAE